MNTFKFKLLYIDDQRTNLEQIKYFFHADESMQVLTALSAEEAFRILTMNSDIHLILLDIQMPQMDGFEVAQILKNNPETEHIPIIFFTSAFDSEEFIKRGYEMGAIDYITKPYDKNILIQKIKQYQNIFAQESLIQEQKDVIISQSRYIAMNEMLSIISHQWRQPLASIASIVATQKIKLELHKEISTKEHLDNYDKIEQTVNDLSSLISLITEMVNPTSNQHNILALHKILGSINTLFSPLLAEHAIEYKVTLDCNENLLIYAPNELIQIIFILLNNAIDALNTRDIADKSISLNVSENESHLFICVSDNAGGIKDDIMEHIFEPYFTTKTTLNGSGLGLYIASLLVKKHFHGQLDVYNNKNGACFTLQFKKEQYDNQTQIYA